MKPKSHRSPAGQNFKDGTLFIADNLHILRGMNSETVDLIYLDPPFNSKRKYQALEGTDAAGQSFDDTWRWDELDVRWLGEMDRRNPALASVVETARLTQGDGTAAYLAFMGVRLLEMRRILKPTGSIWLHCDPTANAYLRVCMDAVFGKANFRNEVVWKRKLGEKHNLASRKMPSSHDVIFYYSKGKSTVFNQPVTPYSDEYKNKNYQYEDARGRYSTFPCTNETGGNKPYEFKGIVRAWRFSKERMERMHKEGLLTQAKPDSPFRYKKYLVDGAGVKIDDCWADIPQVRGGLEKTGWATQKPLALLQRIVKASSNPGDLVLDPFAGCATALVAAAIEGRQWVGIEACEAANDILQIRLSEAKGGALGAGHYKARIARRPPSRTDLNGGEPDHRSKAYRTRDNVDFLYGKQRGICPGCENHYRSKDLHVDHVVPRAKGGSGELDNLQLLCGHCNTTKGAGTMADLRRRLAEQEADMRRRMMAA